MESLVHKYLLSPTGKAEEKKGKLKKHLKASRIMTVTEARQRYGSSNTRRGVGGVETHSLFFCGSIENIQSNHDLITQSERRGGQEAERGMEIKGSRRVRERGEQHRSIFYL